MWYHYCYTELNKKQPKKGSLVTTPIDQIIIIKKDTEFLVQSVRILSFSSNDIENENNKKC